MITIHELKPFPNIENGTYSTFIMRRVYEISREKTNHKEIKRF